MAKFKTLKNRFLFISTVIFTCIYVIWRIFFTIPFGYGMASVFWGMFLLIVEVLGMFEAAVHYFGMSNIQYPVRPEVDGKLYPDVDIYVATYNEPAELLYKTLNGCNNMEYPDKSKVHIYLCDDGNREEMRELARSMQVNYLTRTDRKGAKAGNLNNALAHSTSPLVVVFDADMIPMHDFLTACVPYFLTEEKIGFIQTPQSFYNPDLFQYYLFSESRIPNEQNYFYKDIQVARNKSNSVIFGGSNTMLSRKALEEVGGFYTKVITEDFATGMLIQSKGYKCYAIDEVHASGLSPSDLITLTKQRDRWARGCIQSGRKLNILFRKGLNVKQKLSYVAAITYWYSSVKRLIYIMAPILFSVFGIMVVKCTLWQVLVFWLPMYLLNDAVLKQLSRKIRSVKWTNIYETIMFPSLIIPVILETFGVSRSTFSVTKKDGIADDTNFRIRKSLPHLFFAVLSVIGIVNCIRYTFNTGSMAYSVVLFWLVSNFYNILMAVFFMLGRKTYRKTERFFAEVDCIISYDNNTIVAKTVDISETGIAFLLDTPQYIPNNKPIAILLNTDRYHAEFTGKIVHVEQFKNKWKYAVMLTQIEENNFKQFLNIIYDREPSLPMNLDINSSIYDDLRVNILTRNKKTVAFNRRLPRIRLDKIVESKEHGKVKIVCYNYEYIEIEANILGNADKITLSISEDINVECILVRVLKDEGNGKGIKNKKNHSSSSQLLYSIKDYEMLASNSYFVKILYQWINEYSSQRVQNNKKDIGSSDEFDEMAYL